MCFSATASFTAAAVLIPAGVYCLKRSNQIDTCYWGLAIFPLFFGMQQLLEGGVWLALQQGEEGIARGFALGFLLFSHVIWLGWVAYSSYLTESSFWRKRLFLVMVVIGILFGAAMYLPLLHKSSWLGLSIVNHSIYYDLQLVSDAYVSQRIVTLVYAGIILVPLVLSSGMYHRALGGLIFLSGAVTIAFFVWAFVSVWCYFAAIISLYIFIVINRSVQVENARSMTH